MAINNKSFISAIVLAAGKASRMKGLQKLLLPFNGITIIEKSLSNLMDSMVNEIIIVVGYKSDEILKKIKNINLKKSFKIIYNENYERGISSSIIKGISEINKKSDSVMIYLADQPFIDSSLINELIKIYISSKKGIAVPVNNNVWGHPVIFSLKYKSVLEKISGDYGARNIIENNIDDLIKLEVNNGAVITDIDSASDYKKCRGKLVI